MFLSYTILWKFQRMSYSRLLIYEESKGGLLRCIDGKCRCSGLFVCAACMSAYRLLCIPMLFKSRNRIQIQIKSKMFLLFPDQYVLSFRIVPFAFPVSPIFRKMNKTTNWSCACIQPVVSAYRIELRGKPKTTIRKSVQFWSRRKIKIWHYK